jgi:hypothetical protein
MHPNLTPQYRYFRECAMSSKASFRPVPCIGGWQIVVTWPDARTEQLGFYSSEAAAVRWINNVSDKWANKAVVGKKTRRRIFNVGAIVQLVAAWRTVTNR